MRAFGVVKNVQVTVTAKRYTIVGNWFLLVLNFVCEKCVPTQHRWDEKGAEKASTFLSTRLTSPRLLLCLIQNYKSGVSVVCMMAGVNLLDKDNPEWRSNSDNEKALRRRVTETLAAVGTAHQMLHNKHLPSFRSINRVHRRNSQSWRWLLSESENSLHFCKLIRTYFLFFAYILSCTNFFRLLFSNIYFVIKHKLIKKDHLLTICRPYMNYILFCILNILTLYIYDPVLLRVFAINLSNSETKIKTNFRFNSNEK